MLSLVYRDLGKMRLVKYVGMGALSSRWDVAIEYDVKAGGSNDNEVDNDGDVKDKEV